MNMLLAEGAGVLMALSTALIVLIVAGVVVGLAGVFVTVSRIVLYFTYKKYNKVHLQAGLTCEQAARAFLDAHGLQNVRVEQIKGFGKWLIGNHYDPKAKVIYLRKDLMGKTTITALGVALQKVTIAIDDAKGDKAIQTRGWMQRTIILAPIVFIPLILIGVVLDMVFFKEAGVGTIATTAIAFLFVVVAFIFTILELKIEVRANNRTIELLQNSNLMTGDEIVALKKVFTAYKIAYIAQFLQTLFEMIRLFLKLMGMILKVTAKR